MFKRKTNIENGLIFRDDCITFAQLEIYQDISKTDRQQNFASKKQVDSYKLPEGYIVDGEIRDEEGLKIILLQCLKKWKLRGKYVSISVPDSLLFVRKISVPAEVEDNDLISYVNFELGETIHIPIADPILDVKRKKNREEAVLFATDKSEMMKYTNLLSACRLIGERADASSLALYRFYEKNEMIQNTENYMFLNMTTASTVVSIFTRGELDLNRYFPALDMKATARHEENIDAGKNSPDDILKEIDTGWDSYVKNDVKRGEDINASDGGTAFNPEGKDSGWGAIANSDVHTSHVSNAVGVAAKEETHSVTSSQNSLDDILKKINTGWVEEKEASEQFVKKEKSDSNTKALDSVGIQTRKAVHQEETAAPVLVNTAVAQDALQDLYFELERLINFYRNSLNNGEEDLRYIVFSGDYPYLHEIMKQIADALALEVIDCTNVKITSDGPIDEQWFEAMGLCISEV